MVTAHATHGTGSVVSASSVPQDIEGQDSLKELFTDAVHLLSLDNRALLQLLKQLECAIFALVLTVFALQVQLFEDKDLLSLVKHREVERVHPADVFGRNVQHGEVLADQKHLKVIK